MKKRYSKTVFPVNNVKDKKAMFENIDTTPSTSKKPIKVGKLGQDYKEDVPDTKTVVTQDGTKHEVKLRRKTSTNENDLPSTSLKTAWLKGNSSETKVDSTKKETKGDKVAKPQLPSCELKLASSAILKSIDGSFGSTPISIGKEQEFKSQSSIEVNLASGTVSTESRLKTQASYEMERLQKSLESSNHSTQKMLSSRNEFMTQLSSTEKKPTADREESFVSRSDSIEKSLTNGQSMTRADGQEQGHVRGFKTQVSTCEMIITPPKPQEGFVSKSVSIESSSTKEESMTTVDDQVQGNEKMFKKQVSTCEMIIASPSTSLTQKEFDFRSASVEKSSTKDETMTTADSQVQGNGKKFKTQVSTCELFINSLTQTEETTVSRPVSIEHSSTEKESMTTVDCQVQDDEKGFKRQVSTCEVILTSPKIPAPLEGVVSRSSSIENSSTKEESMTTAECQERENRKELKTQLSSCELKLNSENIEEPLENRPIPVKKRFNESSIQKESDQIEVEDEKDIILTVQDPDMEFFKGCLEAIDSFKVPEPFPEIVEDEKQGEEEENYGNANVSNLQDENKEEYEVETPRSPNDPDIAFFKNCLDEINKYEVKATEKSTEEEGEKEENLEASVEEKEEEYEVRTHGSPSDSDIAFFKNCLDEINKYEVKKVTEKSTEEEGEKEENLECSVEEKEEEYEVRTPGYPIDPDIAFFKNCLDEINKYEVKQVPERKSEEENEREEGLQASEDEKEEDFEVEIPGSPHDSDISFFKNCMDEINKYEVKQVTEKSTKGEDYNSEDEEEEYEVKSPEPEKDKAFFKNCTEETKNNEVIKSTKILQDHLKENEDSNRVTDLDIDDFDSLETSQEESIVQDKIFRPLSTTFEEKFEEQMEENFGEQFEERFEEEVEETVEENIETFEEQSEEKIKEQIEDKFVKQSEETFVEKTEERVEQTRKKFKEQSKDKLEEQIEDKFVKQYEEQSKENSEEKIKERVEEQTKEKFEKQSDKFEEESEEKFEKQSEKKIGEQYEDERAKLSEENFEQSKDRFEEQTENDFVQNREKSHQIEEKFEQLIEENFGEQHVDKDEEFARIFHGYRHSSDFEEQYDKLVSENQIRHSQRKYGEISENNETAFEKRESDRKSIEEEICERKIGKVHKVKDEICENKSENENKNQAGFKSESIKRQVQTSSGSKSTESYYSSDEFHQESSSVKMSVSTRTEKVSKMSYTTSNTSKDFYQENITLQLTPTKIVETKLTNHPTGSTSQSYQETITTIHEPGVVETKILVSNKTYQETRSSTVNADSQLIGAISEAQKERKICSEPYAVDRSYQESRKSGSEPGAELNRAIDFGANEVSNVTNENDQEHRKAGEAQNDRQDDKNSESK